MRKFRVRHATGAVRNDVRRGAHRVTRWLYLGGLLALGLWLVDVSVGALVRFNADGVVLSSSVTVAAEFPLTLRVSTVREGERVDAGALLGVISSQQVEETIARLTGDLAARKSRLSELRIRARTASSMEVTTLERYSHARQTREELDKLHDRGLVPMDKRHAAMEAEFTSRRDAELLQAEAIAVDAEIDNLNPSLDSAEEALNIFRRRYDHGNVFAPISGIVGRRPPSRGAVVMPGEPLFEIYDDERYVVAFLSAGALYDLMPGDLVHVSWGLHELVGRIDRIEAVATALPREFQNVFKPTERAQIARVVFPNGEVPPLFAKVNVHSGKWPPEWLLRAIGRARADLMGWLGFEDAHWVPSWLGR